MSFTYGVLAAAIGVEWLRELVGLGVGGVLFGGAVWIDLRNRQQYEALHRSVVSDRDQWRLRALECEGLGGERRRGNDELREGDE